MNKKFSTMTSTIWRKSEPHSDSRVPRFSYFGLDKNPWSDDIGLSLGYRTFVFRLFREFLSSGGRVLRDSRPLIGWRWHHRTLQSATAATSVGFDHWKKAENDRINQFCQKNYLIYLKSIYFNLLSHNFCTIILPPHCVRKRDFFIL